MHSIGSRYKELPVLEKIATEVMALDLVTAAIANIKTEKASLHSKGKSEFC